MSQSSPHPSRRWSAIAVGLCALALGACGGSASSSASATPASNSEERDTARLKLTQCLRENGVDVPDNPGQGDGGRRSLSDADREKRREAMQGPCKDLREAAVGDISDTDRQAFQDAFQEFAQCMRANGVDIPDPTEGGGPGGGGGGGGLRRGLDSDDPDVQAAQEQCRDKLPQRPGRGGGPAGAQ